LGLERSAGFRLDGAIPGIALGGMAGQNAMNCRLGALQAGNWRLLKIGAWPTARFNGGCSAGTCRAALRTRKNIVISNPICKLLIFCRKAEQACAKSVGDQEMHGLPLPEIDDQGGMI
jgi:hypothetical protein